MTTIYNVVCQSQIVNPEEKATFKKVGYLKVTEAGGHYLHLYHQPNVTYRVFSSREDSLPVIS